MTHPLVLVAAVARNGVIGRDGGMPWHLPGDLAHFRNTTMGHPLLMGRRTFEAIGRALPGRLTTVLSSSPGFAPPGIVVARDLATALAGADAQAAQLGAPAIMVVGGGMLYAATLDLATRMLITEVAATPEGDTRFPRLDPAVWTMAETCDAVRRPADSHPYRFMRWERRGPPRDRNAA